MGPGALCTGKEAERTSQLHGPLQLHPFERPFRSQVPTGSPLALLTAGLDAAQGRWLFGTDF
jgi:hypothetical protein